MAKEKPKNQKTKQTKTMIYTTLHRNLNILQPESHTGRRFANQRHYRELNSKLG
jgi:hypothetical protein